MFSHRICTAYNSASTQRDLAHLRASLALNSASSSSRETAAIIRGSASAAALAAATCLAWIEYKDG